MAGEALRHADPLPGRDSDPDADPRGSGGAGHPAGGSPGRGDPGDPDAGRPAGGGVGEPVAGGPGTAADRDLADLYPERCGTESADPDELAREAGWHYGDASMGEVPDERHHGAGTWPPIYPGPGEGCER